VAVFLHLDGKLYVSMKAIQMVKNPLQLICSMWPDDKGVINITEPALRFVDSLCKGPLLEIIKSHRTIWNWNHDLLNGIFGDLRMVDHTASRMVNMDLSIVTLNQNF